MLYYTVDEDQGQSDGQNLILMLKKVDIYPNNLFVSIIFFLVKYDQRNSGNMASLSCYNILFYKKKSYLIDTSIKNIC